MKTSIPRIGRIFPKTGIAEIRVITNEAGRRIAQYLRDDGRSIALKRQSDIEGYVIVAWGRHGETTTSAFIQSGRWVGKVECAEFVKQAVNAHIFGREDEQS